MGVSVSRSRSVPIPGRRLSWSFMRPYYRSSLARFGRYEDRFPYYLISAAWRLLWPLGSASMARCSYFAGATRAISSELSHQHGCQPPGHPPSRPSGPRPTMPAPSVFARFWFWFLVWFPCLCYLVSSGLSSDLRGPSNGTPTVASLWRRCGAGLENKPGYSPPLGAESGDRHSPSRILALAVPTGLRLWSSRSRLTAKGLVSRQPPV